MAFIDIAEKDGIAVVTLNRGKVNAVNEALIDELRATFEKLKDDRAVRATILTGQGKFFSFGFDVPEFISYPRDDFDRFLTKFTGCCTYLYTFPKPLVIAINGHAIGGGCMLSLTGDYRIMVLGKAKIALNEITFGASIFAGTVEMLRASIGQKNAEMITYSGAMYTGEQANHFGLVDDVATEDTLLREAGKIADDLGKKDAAPFRHIKSMMRTPVAEQIAKREKDGIKEFLDIWYSETTWPKVQNIKIHD